MEKRADPPAELTEERACVRQGFWPRVCRPEPCELHRRVKATTEQFREILEETDTPILPFREEAEKEGFGEKRSGGPSCVQHGADLVAREQLARSRGAAEAVLPWRTQPPALPSLEQKSPMSPGLLGTVGQLPVFLLQHRFSMSKYGLYNLKNNHSQPKEKAETRRSQMPGPRAHSKLIQAGTGTQTESLPLGPGSFHKGSRNQVRGLCHGPCSL